MNFIHTSPFYGGYNGSQQQALQQQQQQTTQQQQQQQSAPQQHSPHTSQSPATSAAPVDQPPQPQALSLPVATLQSFAQANGIPVTAAPELNAQGKPKRKQVKNACVNCQKACKKCDDGRPCQRCIKYGLQDTCVNSVRKERKKGIKRGPYKKRKQDGSASTDGSTSSAPATSLPAGLYAPTTQGAGAGVRTANGVLAYPSFQSGSYDAFHAAAASYQNSASMMQHAYMVPAAIQQMYPANPMLSYQAAMNMLSPQHGQSSPGIYGYPRPDAATSQQQQQQQQQQPSPSQPQPQSQAQDHQADAQGAQHRSHEGSPATPNGVGTPTSTAIKPETNESDDEGSKLNILSQLCSAVLDRTPDAVVKPETDQAPAKSDAQDQPADDPRPTAEQSGTPPPAPSSESADAPSSEADPVKPEEQPSS